MKKIPDKRINFWRTLEELEGSVWPHDDFNSHVVQETQRLRKKAIGDLSPEDLRLLISQQIGLKFLVPIALIAVLENPLVEGAFYKGDLLSALLKLPDSFWNDNRDLWYQLLDVQHDLEAIAETVSSELLPLFRRQTER